MARVRHLKPGFNKDEDIAVLSPWARLFFQGMWGLCDRRGVVEDRPVWLKGEILPHDDVNPEALLEELARPRRYSDGPFILRYVGRDGRRYILIRNFAKHQRPHPDEKPSSAPLPEDPSSGAPPPPPPSTPVATPASPGSPEAASGGTPADHSSATGQPGETPAGTLPTTGEPGSAVGTDDAAVRTDGSPTGQQASNLSLISLPEPEQRRPLPLIVEGADPPSDAETHPAPKEPRCVVARGEGLCGALLVRETGRYAASSPTTGGRGWFCDRRTGGCGQVYARQDVRVWTQLSERARDAIRKEILAEGAVDATQAARRYSLDPSPDEVAVFSRREELAAEFHAWFRIHVREGELWGTAWARWADQKGWAPWVRDGVRLAAFDLHRDGNADIAAAG